MAHCKYKKAEEAKQQKGIEDLRRFTGAVIPYLPVCLIPVIEWQQRLYDPCHPEESQQASYKHEHLPFTNIGTGKMAFSKNNADYQENNRLHQLKQLES
jgi:hypothetical protein